MMPTWAIEAFQLLAPSGAVIWAVKYALNGTRQRIVDVHGDVRELKNEVKEIRGELRDLSEDNRNVHGRLWLIEERAKRDVV